MKVNQSHLKAFAAGVVLPRIPEVTSELVKSFQDDDVDIRAIASLISKDPAIATNILRHANSARYGLSKQIVSVDSAIQMLGMNEVRSIALGVSVASSFPNVQGLTQDQFTRYCTNASEFSARLAKACSVDKSAAWLVGFIGRVGEVIIAQKAPAVVRDIESGVTQIGQRWFNEFKELGFFEGHMVSTLAKSWDFPAAMVQALSDSYLPLEEDAVYQPLTCVAHIASLLADGMSLQVKEKITIVTSIQPGVLERLGLSEEALFEIYEDVTGFKVA